MIDLSVIIPTHNPDSDRLRRTLAGLSAQTMPSSRWELIVVDNASTPPLDPAALAAAWANSRLLREPRLGLTFARRRGLRESRAARIVLVDDDNVLEPDYLAEVDRLFSQHPQIGALGGRILPAFEREPEPWQTEFLPLLSLRDHGDQPRISAGLRPPGGGRASYPAEAAPVGAGMGLRREAIDPWMAEPPRAGLPDRSGREFSSGGDNDMIFVLLEQGWEVGYFPELKLTHLIPAGRLETEYLGRINHGIQKSWMQVLSKHGANPWPPLSPWAIPLRKAKAWCTYRAWSGPAARIRWRGACGHFEGRLAAASAP